MTLHHRRLDRPRPRRQMTLEWYHLSETVTLNQILQRDRVLVPCHRHLAVVSFSTRAHRSAHPATIECASLALGCALRWKQLLLQITWEVEHE